MPKPGSPEWHARVARIRAEEATEPEQWWYLSFVDGSRPEGQQFLGAAIVRARGMTGAIQEAHRRGCNPGGEVMAIATDAEPPFPKNKLLSKAELGPGTTVGELEDAGRKAGPHVQFSEDKAGE